VTDEPTELSITDALRAAIDDALAWMKERQLFEEPGDWRATRPQVPGGGWPFQFQNDYYPDLDDTAQETGR